MMIEMYDNQVVVHTTNKKVSQTNLDSTNVEFLDRYSASMCSTVN
jgi:hypothetical protein